MSSGYDVIRVSRADVRPLRDAAGTGKDIARRGECHSSVDIHTLRVFYS